MDLVETVEGRTRLLVPPGNKDAGPGTREGPVFFNPAMAFSRDVGVLTVAALGREARILDGLAGSGARGIRYAVEAGARATLNDWNPIALDLAQQNAARNGVEVEIHRRNLAALLWEGAWDVVDVDPFGSPATFVDAASRAVVRGGLLGVTATDTAALHGLYPEVCRRRYLAEPMRCEFGHEVALRILGGFVLRQGAKHDVALTPVLSYAKDHAYRVVARARKGATAANAALERLGRAWWCKACEARGMGREAPAACPACGAEPAVAGPLWTGSLHDPGFLAAMTEAATPRELARKDDVLWDLAVWSGEAESPALFYDAHAAAGRAGVDPWPIADLLSALLGAGFHAARSHANPWGVKTDATEAELRRVLAERQR